MKKHFEEVIKVWLEYNQLEARPENIEALAETLALSKIGWTYKRRLKSDKS